ncbi:hypothetical protein D9M71_378180 [compost metagenome]
MHAVVLQLHLAGQAVVAGDLGRVVAAAELAAADAELFRAEQRITERSLAGDGEVEVHVLHDRAHVLDALGIELQLGEVGLAAVARRVAAVFRAGAHDVQALAELGLDQVAAAVLVGEVVTGAQTNCADTVVAGRRLVRVVQVFRLAVEPCEADGRLQRLRTAADPRVGDARRQGVARAVGVQRDDGVRVAFVVLAEQAEDGAIVADRHVVLAFDERHLVAFH